MKTSSITNNLSTKIIYKAGGWTAILFLLYTFVTLLIFALIGEGYPETATECFEMIKQNRFIALLRLDLVSVVIIPFFYVLYFSIYYSLKQTHEILAKVALFCTIIGISLFIAGLNISSILILSDKYYLAADSPERQQLLLAACEGMLASDMWISTSALIRGILIETGALIFSVMMFRTTDFYRITAWVGVITHGFDLASGIMKIFYPPIEELFTMIAGPFYIFWFILIAINLIQLGNRKNNNETIPQ